MKAVEFGKWVEDQAEQYLKCKGYRVLRKRVQLRFTDVDLLATDGGQLVVVEVRARRNGGALASLNARKRGRLHAASIALEADRIDLLDYDSEGFVHYENIEI